MPKLFLSLRLISDKLTPGNPPLTLDDVHNIAVAKGSNETLPELHSDLAKDSELAYRMFLQQLTFIPALKCNCKKKQDLDPLPRHLATLKIHLLTH